MQRSIVAGALLLAGAAIAGVASAGDDCAMVVVPGYYAGLCLFNDHGYSYDYCSSWGCSSVSASSNQLAAATASGPGMVARGDTTQNTYSFADCTPDACSSGTSDGTYALLSLQAAGFQSYSTFDQYRSNGSRPWGPYSAHGTTAITFHQATVLFLGLPVGVHFSQHGRDGQCNSTVSAWVVFGVGSPFIPCSQSTPAGSVSTKVLNLHSTCVDTGTAAGSVCGRYPDMPDDTGLPFL